MIVGIFLGFEFWGKWFLGCVKNLPSPPPGKLQKFTPFIAVFKENKSNCDISKHFHHFFGQENCPRILVLLGPGHRHSKILDKFPHLLMQYGYRTL